MRRLSFVPSTRHLASTLMVAMVALASVAEPAAGQALARTQTTANAAAPVSDPSGLALRPGDLIEIRTWADSTMAGDYMVDEDGNVVLPLLGMRQATAVPADQLRRQLTTDYQAFFRLQEAVQVVPKRRIRVLGEVRLPGLYHVDPTMTLGDALALAGGIVEPGDSEKIRILNEGAEVVETEVSLEAPIMNELRSGDQILVPAKPWLSRNAAIFVGAAASGVVYLLFR